VTLNDLSDEQLKAKLSQSKLGKRRASIAKAVLRRRRADRIRKWLQRNPWLAFLIGAVGWSASAETQKLDFEGPTEGREL
jgi:hypothetical protein